MSQKIAIYQGEGTWYQGVVPGKLLSAHEIIEGGWEPTTSLFIMPGGRDRLYHAALQGAGNAKIRSFVELGGTYLGICAGASTAARGWNSIKDDRSRSARKEETLIFFWGRDRPRVRIRHLHLWQPRRFACSRPAHSAGPLPIPITMEAAISQAIFLPAASSPAMPIFRTSPPPSLTVKSARARPSSAASTWKSTPIRSDANEPHFAACIPFLRLSEAHRIRFWKKFVHG